MEVVFGTPSQNCIGAGICMVLNQLPPGQLLRCPHAPAWISFKQGRLIFRFSKSGAVRKDALCRLDAPWFLVQEPFQVPRYTARQLAMPTQWIPAGLYLIEGTAQDWVLAFDLSLAG